MEEQEGSEKTVPEVDISKGEWESKGGKEQAEKRATNTTNTNTVFLFLYL